MIIDVWSDVVCPWCFIGKRRLEKAIAALPEGTAVTVRHRAFQLDPAAQGVTRTSNMLAEKYRVSPAQVGQMQERVCAIADGEGLCYDLADTMSGNTRDAHRLLLAAGDQQAELLEVMYSRYFENGGGLFTHEDLRAAAAAAGIDPELADAVLDSEAYAGEVAADQQTAQQLGANGVPFFVIDMAYAISGAQDQSVFDQTLEAALAAAGT